MSIEMTIGSRRAAYFCTLYCKIDLLCWCNLIPVRASLIDVTTRMLETRAKINPVCGTSGCLAKGTGGPQAAGNWWGLGLLLLMVREQGEKGSLGR